MLKVPRSTYYGAIKRPKSKRAIENEKLSIQIKDIWLASKKRYGYPKITAQLKRNDVQVGSKRVWKQMNLMGIRSITMRKYRHYKSREKICLRNNILNRQFSTPTINQKWTADITYIKTKRNGWTYLASILDLKSRKIIGWSYGRKMTTQLVIVSLERAMENQGYPDGVLIHSDMGSQYTSDLFTAKTTNFNMIQSFSKKGCPYDNASIESFHGILKREEVNLRTYQDYYTAKNELFDFIEGWYNRNRLHGSLGYKTPQEVEDECKSRTKSNHEFIIDTE